MSPIHRPGKDNKRSQERLRLITYRLRVFVWHGTKSETPERDDGFSFVSDFSNGGVGIYLSDKISAGSSVRVAFETATSATFKGIVQWENRVSYRQQFIGHEALSYRVGVKFLFGSEAERQRYLKYLEEVKQKVAAIKPGMAY